MSYTSLTIKLLTGTHPRLINLSVLLLRWTVGGILFAVGAGKVLGWFGGMGFQMTVQAYQTGNGISAPFAYMSMFTEFIGGLFFILGFLTRPAAIAVFINMLVAFLVMLPAGFIAGGASYPFSLMISAVIIMLTGPLAYSIDYLMLNRNKL